MLNRLLYTSLLWLLLPYVFFHLVWRARKQPEYLQYIGERFGFYTRSTNKPVIWLHTVSVGETRAAASLIQRIRAHYPSHQILLTHTTPTGRATSTQLYGNDVIRVYLPYDYPFAVRRFLRHFQPRIGILLETEIWFNLTHACHQLKLPLMLLNARLSEKSLRRYARFPKLVHQGLSELSGIAAQTDADADRLASLGGQAISVMGNLKYDITPPEEMLIRGNQLRELFGVQRKIFLVASTRDGEELAILEAVSHAALGNMLLVIVPRHPQRFDEVANLIHKMNFSLQRRSDNAPVHASTQVVLGDSMGEMFAYYAACDLAFIGGSLLPFGGQNLIEACAVGKPVLIGPHTYNFAQASELAVAAGAAQRVADAGALVASVKSLFENPELMHTMGMQAQHFVRTNQGATERALHVIDAALAKAQRSA